jgi:hypothetical protein
MAATTRTTNQLIATTFGAVYVVVGLVGFLVDRTGFADTEGEKLLGLFEVNPLHNLAHIAIGVALMASGRALASARVVNGLVGAAYLLLGVLGLFILDSEVNILALNEADNALHLGSAALLLAVSLGADKSLARPAA